MRRFPFSFRYPTLRPALLGALLVLFGFLSVFIWRAPAGAEDVLLSAQVLSVSVSSREIIVRNPRSEVRTRVLIPEETLIRHEGKEEKIDFLKAGDVLSMEVYTEGSQTIARSVRVLKSGGSKR